MATESVTAPARVLTDGESGAIQGLSPIDRVNRLHFMLDGLAALERVCDSAIHAPEEHQSTDIVWEPLFYMKGIILKDLRFEVSALHHQMWGE
jgi:hypothetical protein